jgi:hypothetical protein
MSRVRVRGWWLLPLCVAAVLATPWPTWLVEHLYSRRLYPRIQHVLTGLTNSVAWAVMDAMLIGAALYVLWRLVRTVVAARDRGVGSALWELGRRLLRTSAMIAAVFLLVWGMNYRRVPLEQALRGESQVTVSAEDIQRLAEAAATSARDTRPVDTLTPSLDELATRLAPSFQAALQSLGYPPITIVGRPKVSVVLTPFFTAAGVTGMVNPLALESIIYPELLPFERPMVLAHEWAHLAGVADEADASAVAWLTCTRAGADLAYSGHLFLVIESSGAVPRTVWRDVRATLGPGVISDLAALTQRLTRQEPVVRDTAFKVYDGYLRSNSVPDGVRSYSRVLRVLAALDARRRAGQ